MRTQGEASSPELSSNTVLVDSFFEVLTRDTSADLISGVTYIETGRMQRVDFCRACSSRNILETGVTKSFYLLNMDQLFELSYSICGDCQFIFLADYVGDDFIEEYYRKGSYLRRSEITNSEMIAFRQQSEFLSKHRPLYGNRVLEIGADTGQFLLHLKYAFNCEVYYDELSIEAKAIIEKQGLLPEFSSLESKPELDVIVVRHVLEHIFDLDGFLAYCESLLKPDGCLFIEVPDWSHLDENTDGFNFEHLNQFNSNSLTTLLKRNGFVLEHLEKSQWEEFATPNRVIRAIAQRSSVARLGEGKIIEDFRAHYRVKMESFLALDRILERLPEDTVIGLYPGAAHTFTALRETGLPKFKVSGIYDIDSKKQGRVFEGITIKAPEKLLSDAPDLVFVLTQGRFELEIAEYLTELGVQAKILTYSNLPEYARTNAS